MTVGLPGAGIGGLFYLASAVLLPFRRVLHVARGKPRQRSFDISTMAIAGGILAAVWVTGWLLGFIVPAGTVESAVSIAGASAARNVLRVATLGIAAGTLAAVLVAVEVARLGRRRTPHERRPRRWS